MLEEYFHAEEFKTYWCDIATRRKYNIVFGRLSCNSGHCTQGLSSQLGTTTNMKWWHTNLIPKASKSFGIEMLRDRTYSSTNAEEPDVHMFFF